MHSHSSRFSWLGIAVVLVSAAALARPLAAADLESLARPRRLAKLHGERLAVFVSDEITRRVADLGERELKGVPGPWHLYRVAP